MRGGECSRLGANATQFAWACGHIKARRIGGGGRRATMRCGMCKLRSSRGSYCRVLLLIQQQHTERFSGVTKSFNLCVSIWQCVSPVLPIAQHPRLPLCPRLQPHPPSSAEPYQQVPRPPCRTLQPQPPPAPPLPPPWAPALAPSFPRRHSAVTAAPPFSPASLLSPWCRPPRLPVPLPLPVGLPPYHYRPA